MRSITYSDQQVTRREDGPKPWKATGRMEAGLDLGPPRASYGNEELFEKTLELLSGQPSGLDAQTVEM